MIPRRKSRLGPLAWAARGPLVWAALGFLLVQGWALALPLLHAAHESGESRGRQASATFVAGCPLDCQDPGHEHRAHDPATCSTCQAGRAVGSLARVVRLDAGRAVAARVETHSARPRALDCEALPRLRGPPAPSAA